MLIFPCFWKTRVLWTPEVCIFATVSSFLLSINKSLNNSRFSRHHTFSRRLTFPVSTRSFLWSVFLSWSCTALFQEIPSIRSFLPLGESFKYQSINHLDLVVSYEFSSWRARVPAYAWVAFPRSRTYALVLCQGNVMETDTPNRWGYECQSARTFWKFLVKCSTSGGFFVNFYKLFFSTTSSILLRKV